MPEFNASLLREKFVIHDAMPSDITEKEPVIALSNRLTLPLRSDNGELAETFIVRAQNMHSCARLGAQVAREFYEHGPLMARSKPFDWHYAYQSITKGYEATWNPNRWVAVYFKGRLVFEDGAAERHLFLDIIEQCDARNKGDYEKAIEVAQDAFKQAGKMVNIKYDSNIAMIMAVTPEEGKCGLIVRGPNRTTTFNITARKKADRFVRPSQLLTAAATYLEGIQLAFFTGVVREKVKYDLIANTAPEARQAEDAGQKLGRLNGAIAQLENLLEVTYRPERPEFSRMLDEAAEYARKMLSAEIERKIATGEVKEWVR